MGKSNRRGLSERLSVCRTTLWSRFVPFLTYRVSSEEINKLFPVKLAAVWVLGLDGMWLHRFGAVMIYRDVTSRENLYWSWHKSESYQNLVDDFYQVYLLTKFCLPSGIISDWKGSIVALVEAFFPGIPHQRCLAHLIRLAKRLLPAGSPFWFTLSLREIVEKIIFISDPTDYFVWQTKLEKWQKDYSHVLKRRTINPETQKGWWYTHGNLRRAIRLLTKDQNSLFLFLHHPFLPKTNNSLEGVNSQLKGKLGCHRGMRPEQQVTFCFWYLAFSRVKTKEDLQKLWASLKKKISVV